MFFKTVLYHILPFFIAVILAFTIIHFSSPWRTNPENEITVVKGKQNKKRGYYANLLNGKQDEINIIASIKQPEQITIFGSSEFTNSPYVSYNFLPDSIGIPSLGLGHAYHQEFSIISELLASKEYLYKSKICIVLSPGWFQKEEATNSEAFIEFVRPNFLNKIAADTSIQPKYRNHIGKYINNYEDQFSLLSPSMKILRDEYVNKNGSSIEKLKLKLAEKIMDKPSRFPVSYDVKTQKRDSLKIRKINWEEKFHQIQSKFMASITNNAIWVNDEYFSKYLINENGKVKRGSIDKIEISKLEEYQDFRLLIDLIEEYEIDCCFIIQPINPYYYDGLENLTEIIDAIKSNLKEKGIPYLNLFEIEKSKYEPGTLNDVMHLGDLGWMKVNRFLYSTYYE